MIKLDEVLSRPKLQIDYNVPKNFPSQNDVKKLLYESLSEREFILWGSRFYGDNNGDSDYDFVLYDDTVNPDALNINFKVTKFYNTGSEQFILSRVLLQTYVDYATNTLYLSRYNGDKRVKVDIFLFPEASRPIVGRIIVNSIGWTKAKRKITTSWNNEIIRMTNDSSR